MTYDTLSFDTCPRCGQGSAELEDRNPDWIFLRCGKCHNRGRYPATPEVGSKTDWESDAGVLESGLTTVMDDMRVIAGRGAEGIWVKVIGPPDEVMGSLSTEVQGRVKTVLGEHLD